MNKKLTVGFGEYSEYQSKSLQYTKYGLYISMSILTLILIRDYIKIVRK